MTLEESLGRESIVFILNTYISDNSRPSSISSFEV